MKIGRLFKLSLECITTGEKRTIYFVGGLNSQINCPYRGFELDGHEWLINAVEYIDVVEIDAGV